MTWKADGTRYMMLVTQWGCYLIDRSGAVRRVTMRFPTLLPPEKSQGYPVGPPHAWTLLDGTRDNERGGGQRAGQGAREFKVPQDKQGGIGAGQVWPPARVAKGREGREL